MSTLAQRDDAAFEQVVASVREHTHSLLGLTIGFTDDEWAGASRLPGWTRSHVAAHLAGGARGMSRVCAGLRDGEDQRMYVSDREKAIDIERGSLASGVELQVGLDETAGALDGCWMNLLGDEREVSLRSGYRLQAQDLPLARLYELVIHTFDMRTADDRLNVSAEVSPLLLEFMARQVGDRPDLPAVEVVAHEGFDAVLGAPGTPARIAGSAADLLMWLARGVSSARLQGDPPPPRGIF